MALDPIALANIDPQAKQLLEAIDARLEAVEGKPGVKQPVKHTVDYDDGSTDVFDKV